VFPELVAAKAALVKYSGLAEEDKTFVDIKILSLRLPVIVP
jgi:hypothetical protein